MEELEKLTPLPKTLPHDPNIFCRGRDKKCCGSL